MATSKILEYILRSKKEGDAAKQTAEDLGALGEKAKKTGEFTKFLGDNFALTGQDIVGMAKALPAATMELLDQGIAIEKAEKALIGYTGSSEEARRAIDAVVNATGGTITKFQATQNATRLFSMGLASTTDEAAKLTEMAVTLGAAMGQDAATSFEDFSLMLANQSIPRLDTFGISGAEVRNRMVELTQEIQGLDRQTAFMMATMEIGGEALKGLGEAGFQATDNVARLKAEMGNLKDGLATTVADGLMPMIDEGFRLKDTINALVESTVTGSESYDDYLARMAELEKKHPIIYAGTVTLTQAQWALERASKGLTDETRILGEAASEADMLFGNYAQGSDDLTGSLEGTTGATDDLIASTDTLTLSLMKVTEAKIAQEAIEALTGAYQDGTLDGDAYDAMVKSIMSSFGGMTSAEADASIALQHLQDDYEAGRIDALEYFEAVTSLGGSIRDIPNNVNVDIWIKTHGSIPDQIAPKKGGKAIALQSGGQFQVTGPPGIDAVPVSFLATRGETVTVTPQGLKTPGSSGGGLTIDARGAQFFGVAGIEDFAAQLLPYLEDAGRNI